MSKMQSSLPGPKDIYREVLSNGITVLTRSNFNSPSVVIRGFFEAGALFDPDEKLGLADFVTSALMRGTKKHNFDEIYNILESTSLNQSEQVWASIQVFINQVSADGHLLRIFHCCLICCPNH